MRSATAVGVISRSSPRKMMSLVIAVREALMGIKIILEAQTVSRERMSVMEKPLRIQ